MSFKKYEKVNRWDNQKEIEGINIGTVHIFEKIDGANASVHTEEGLLFFGKRSGIFKAMKFEDLINKDLEFDDKDFRGMARHLLVDGTKLYNFFIKYPQLYLHGEWLVPHTVLYGDEYWNHFYVFDVYALDLDRFLTYEEYKPILTLAKIDYIPLLKKLEDPSMEELIKMVQDPACIPPSDYGAERIEGLVYKNYQYVNHFGRTPYMKAVTKDFDERKSLVFKSNKRDDIEIRLIDKHLASVRMEKIYQKMIDDKNNDSGWSVPITMKDMGEFLGRIFYDLFHEEAWNMLVRDKLSKNKPINIGKLKRACDEKTRHWYILKLKEEVTK